MHKSSLTGSAQLCAVEDTGYWWMSYAPIGVTRIDDVYSELVV